MMRKICDVCGRPFETRKWSKMYCGECMLTMHKATKLEEKPKESNNNQKILEQVREATKLHLSYGQYVGRGK